MRNYLQDIFEDKCINDCCHIMSKGREVGDNSTDDDDVAAQPAEAAANTVEERAVHAGAAAPKPHPLSWNRS